jgi:hypothetical protein
MQAEPRPLQPNFLPMQVEPRPLHEGHDQKVM